MGKKGKQSKKKGKRARKGRKHETVQASKNYTITDGTAVRTKKSCPRCGQGTFLAQHKNRATCGRCGYTVIEKK